MNKSAYHNCDAYMPFITKFAVILLFISSTITVCAQSKKEIDRQINGAIINKPAGTDTIFFTHGPLDNKYYTGSLLPSGLSDNRYAVANKLPYPQMFKIYFSSDKNKLVWRKGVYFIDATTTRIKTDYLADNCSELNGLAAKEYTEKFIPFVTKGMTYDCRSDYLADLFYDQSKKADSLLLNYVTQNPGSYVGLWRLIERFSNFGESTLRQKIMARFSSAIKQSKLWITLNNDLKSAPIKENEQFPAIGLKTINLVPTKFTLPKAKYTLIDFWFARCRPCLDTIPALKRLYSSYRQQGFEIVSISVDETANIPIWQKRVKEHELSWCQYLEENNFKVNELGIKRFPTFILLDEAGKVIWKDFDLQDLDTFLKQHS